MLRSPTMPRSFTYPAFSPSRLPEVSPAAPLDSVCAPASSSSVC
jgi:hypothetical protein